MKAINNFSIHTIPIHKVAAIATSDHSYEMDRTMLVENYPDYGDYTVVHGSHCSCYGFDDTKWDATTYTKDELKLLVVGWMANSYGSEAIIAPLISRYIG